MIKRLLFLLLLPALALAQTQHDRIDARGQVKTDKFINRATIIITGATPDVSNGNVFKTNNGGVVTITNFLNGVDTQVITVNCGDANTTIQNNANIVNTSGADFACGVNKTISYIYDSAQVKWIQSGTGSGGGGGGGSPGAPANCLQKNNGSGGFAASAECSDGATLTVSEDIKAKGPNPYVDVTAYGVRSAANSNVAPFIPGITATMSASSTTATLSSASTFQNGDGVAIQGAGATNTMSTPSAPTVTPSLNASAIGMTETVPSPSGATSYQYQVACLDKFDAITVASSAGTTSTGQATLGRIAVTVTSMTRSNATVSVVTASPTTLSVGAAVYYEGSSDLTFNGAFLVATVTDSTHFTFTAGNDTRAGAAASATGGTLSYLVGNHITWSAVPGSFRCVVYGRTGGGMAYIGIPRPGENRWDDYGATISGAPFRPYYIPSTPPVVATNDTLVTTIVSGAGSTTLSLVATATNSVSGTTILFDNTPNLQTAAMAAGGAPLYFPNGGNFVFNSYMIWPTANVNTIQQRGQLVINETWEVPRMDWIGDQGGSSNTVPQFAATRRLVALAGYPGIYAPAGAGRFRGILFNDAHDQALAFLEEANFPGSHFEDTTFNTGGGVNDDYLGVGYLGRGASNIEFVRSQFNATMNNSSLPIGFYAPSLQVRGDLPNGNPAGRIILNDVAFTPKGIGFDMTVQFCCNLGHLEQVYSQGGRTPLLVIAQSFNGQLASLWTIKDITMDTTFAPVVANFTQSSFYANFFNIGNFSAGPILTGNAASATVSGILANLGQNVGVVSGSSFTNNVVQVNSLGAIGTTMPTPAAAPTFAVSAGGNVPIGTWNYGVVFIDANSRTVPVSPTVAVTTTPGNQTVTITRPTPPAGAVAWVPVRSNGGGFQIVKISGSCAGLSAGQLSGIEDNSTGICATLGAPTGATATSIGSNGLLTTKLTLWDPNASGFTTTQDFPNPLTANRFFHMPNVSGTPCLDTLCTVNAVTINGDASLSSSPRSMPPVFFPGALTATWTGASWTLDKAITVTRVQSAVKVAPAGCSTSAVVRLTDGSTPVNLTVNAATNDSGTISQNYAAGATLTVSVQTAASGCTTSPGDLNVSIQSRMQ